jgi:hypothetical protein
VERGTRGQRRPPAAHQRTLRHHQAPIALILIEFKIRIEERFMTAEFPQEYPRYRRRVPQLVPGLRVVTGHQDVAG